MNRNQEPTAHRESDADRLERENPGWTDQDGAGDAGRAPGDLEKEPKPDEGGNRLGERDVPFEREGDPARRKPDI